MSATSVDTDQRIQVSQLTHEHLGRWISVHGLHAPGADFNDESTMTVTGRLMSFIWTIPWKTPQCRLILAGKHPLGGTFEPYWTITLHATRPQAKDEL